MKKLTAALLVSVFLVPLTFAQDVTVNADVVTALTWGAVTTADFGDIPVADNDVVLDPVDNTTTNALGNGNAGTISLTGAVNETVNISFTATTLTSTDDPGTDIDYTPLISASDENTQSSSSLINNNDDVTLDGAAGDYYFWVGGTLNIDATTNPADDYTGTVTLTATYTNI